MASQFAVRLAHEADVHAVAEMVEDFVPVDHPARKHTRSIEKLREAYFGPTPVATLYVATRAIATRKLAGDERRGEELSGDERHDEERARNERHDKELARADRRDDKLACDEELSGDARHDEGLARDNKLARGDRRGNKLARDEELVGMVQWQPFFDVWWSMLGGRVEWLYVRPSARGFGVSALLIARVAADVRRSGGVYLLGGYSSELAPFYERVVRAWPSRDAALSAEAFHTMADLDGKSPRDIVRGLPARDINKVQRPPT